MDGKRLMRLAIGVVGALSAAAVLFALLVKVNAGWGFGGCTGTSAFGWTLPLIAGLLIGGVAWLLLFTAPAYHGDDERKHSVPCPSCDKAVMADWRLCPYCGRILPLESPVDGTAEQHG